MIVFPRLLGDLLEQVDRTRAAHPAPDFARHVLDIERNEIAEPVPAACPEHVEAAHEAIDLGEAPPRLPEAKEQLLEVAARWDTDRHVLVRGAGPTLDAARVGTERMLAEAAGRGPGTPIPCLYVARRARWEKARRQVRHIIATEPGPHGDAR